MSKPNYPIVLASASPRRLELLKAAGLDFYVRAADADETVLPKEKPDSMVRRLAITKAQAVMKELLREVGMGLVIGADTTVVGMKGEILGKPLDVIENQVMLKKLSGKTHFVLTGYCLMLGAREMKPKTFSRVIKTRVTFRKLSSEQIRFYAQSGEGLDKAGGYAIQGLGASLVSKISGSYTNVVGLPVAELVHDLRVKFGITDGII